MTFVGEIMEVVEAQTNVMYKVGKINQMVSLSLYYTSHRRLMIAVGHGLKSANGWKNK